MHSLQYCEHSLQYCEHSLQYCEHSLQYCEHPWQVLASPGFWKQLLVDWQLEGGTPEAADEILQRLGGNVQSGSVSGAKPSPALMSFMAGSLRLSRPAGNNYSSSGSQAERSPALELCCALVQKLTYSTGCTPYSTARTPYSTVSTPRSCRSSPRAAER